MVSRVALSFFRDAQQGQADAQLALGRLYLYGEHGMKRSPGTALYWLHKAASAGNAEARRLIEEAGAANRTKAAKSKAAQGGASADGGAPLPELVLTGHPAGEPGDAEALRRAAAGGDRKAQLRLALLLERGSAAQDAVNEEAFHWLVQAAENGSKAAAFRLADWYWERFDPSVPAALEEVTDAAEPGFLHRLGVLYLASGRAREAAVLLGKAALLDHAPSQTSYAMLYASRLGKSVTSVAHSPKKTAFWLEKASHGGCPQASFELYRLFRTRDFPLKSAALAQKYLETAAAQAHAHAQYLAGLSHLDDKIGRDSDVAAATWLLKAAKQGHAEAAAVARLLYGRGPATAPGLAAEQSRLTRLLARTRMALAVRVELAQVFRLTIPELLMFDSQQADRGDFIVLDVRRHTRGGRRRIIAVETEEERALLDRARKLLDARDPHPSDVRGPLPQRRRDLKYTVRLVLGRRLGEMGWGE